MGWDDSTLRSERHWDDLGVEAGAERKRQSAASRLTEYLGAPGSSLLSASTADRLNIFVIGVPLITFVDKWRAFQFFVP